MSGMTDIVFLLLIFFMLTSTLIAPERPEDAASQPGTGHHTGRITDSHRDHPQRKPDPG
jgi:biopolymer transport protein ExbD